MKRRTFLTVPAATAMLGLTGSGLPFSVAGEHDGGAALARSNRQATPGATPIASIEPGTAALLVLDYQPAWIETLTDTDALLDRAAEAIAIARDRGAPVAYARVAFTSADYEAVPERNIIFNVLASVPGALDDDAPRTAIDDRVAPRPDDKVVRKTRVGAFARTDLDEWLRDRGVDTLILAGISTSGVVLSTVCDAADRDYRLIVLADACADQDPEIHHVLTHKIFPQRAQVITVAELPGLLMPVS